MLILGIDPGSRYTGYGLVRRRGREAEYVTSGRINAAKAGDFDARLPLIYRGMTELLETYSPTAVAIEAIFTAYNAQSTIKLGHARGVAVLAVSHAELPMSDYPPARVKKTVAGHGRAKKEQVQQMVKMRLGIDGDLAEDAADALAVALCHCQAAEFERHLG